MVETYSDSDPYERARQKLVEMVRRNTGVDNERILQAFATVPRHLFVPESERAAAYQDRALPIGEDQTISQPSMIAIMLAELDPQPGDHSLEVGGGSGYAAALLGQLVREVDAIELRGELAARASSVLRELGYANVRIVVGDGSLGLPERAPYEKILVSGGAESIPDALISQLALGGRIAIPVGNQLDQSLLVGDRAEDGTMTFRTSTSCIFVPLVRPNQPFAS